jgi:fatty acid desaturase
MKYSGHLPQSEELEFEKISITKSMLSIVISWAVIAIAMYLTISISYWLFPLSFALIANRQLALSLISHEGLHRTLLPHPLWNDFAARYFCAFPVFISLSRYRAMHLAHHRFLGTPLDPDLALYRHYPLPLSRYLKKLALSFFSGKMLWNFMDYYTDIPSFFRRSIPLNRKSIRALPYSSDFISYILFTLISSSLIHWLNLGYQYFFLWLLPSLVYLPYILTIGGLQHGPLQKEHEVILMSRSIIGCKPLMEMLLPIDINFHAEHHLNPRIPHYRLREYSLTLRKRENRPLWRESYSEALKKLFH